MATRKKKAKSVRRARPKSTKAVRQRGKDVRKSLSARVAKKAKKPASKKRKNAPTKRRAVTKRTAPKETILVDTIEEPVPGVMVVTETEDENKDPNAPPT